MSKKPKSEVVKIDPMEKIARLLALSLTRELGKDAAAIQLGSAGFDDGSVSELLGIPESTIRGIRFRRTKKTTKKRKPR